MRKFMDSRISWLAVAVLATSLLGCRSTASHLANVPGFGWLDRGDEGWANYEPSPDLPKPSDTAEPTPSSPTSNIASNDKSGSPFSNPVLGADEPESKSRFDINRYLPKKKQSGETPDTKPSFGNYASAYGKYSPPKLDRESSDTDSATHLAAQEGPYRDEPKLANAGPGTDPTPPSNAPAFGPALDEQFESQPRQPEYTASSDSRFGAPAFDSHLNTSTAAAPPSTAASNTTYTPPGFPTSPQANPVANRFDTTNRFDSTPNRFDNPVQSPPASAAPAFDRFTNSALPTQAAAASTLPNTGAPQNQVFQPNGGQALPAFTNPMPNAQPAAAASQWSQGTATPSSAASATGPAFTNTAYPGQSPTYDTFQNAVAGAQGVAADYRQAANATAANVANDFRNGFANAAVQTQAASSALQNASNYAVQGATNVLQGATQQMQTNVGATVNSFEQEVVSRYDQAKSAASNFANSAVHNATQQANNLFNAGGTPGVVGAAPNIPAMNTRFDQQQPAASPTNPGAASSATATSYPSTSTPNPFLNPVNVTPPPAGSSNVPVNTTPPPQSSPAIQRSATPFLPGSTKPFQSSSVTVRKQEMQLASAGQDTREPLMLAVGDIYQFPRNLR